MAFKPGESGNPMGRPAGAGNKTTQQIRSIFQELLSNEIEAVRDILPTLPPERRIDTVLKMAEFILPKLQRIEMPKEEKERPDRPLPEDRLRLITYLPKMRHREFLTEKDLMDIVTLDDEHIRVCNIFIDWELQKENPFDDDRPDQTSDQPPQ